MYKKSLEIRHFLVSPYPDEAGPASSWAGGVAWDGQQGIRGSNGASRCILKCSGEAKTVGPALTLLPAQKSGSAA